MPSPDQPEGATDAIGPACDPHTWGEHQREDLPSLARALKAGAAAPNFRATDARKRPVTLSRLLESGPTIVTFHRGSWCLHCRSELEALAALYPDFAGLDAQILVLSPEKPERLGGLAEYPFTLAIDRGCRIARCFGVDVTVPQALRATYISRGHDLAEVNASADWALPLPATYVVDRSGMIAFSKVALFDRNRFDPAELLPVLASLARRLRG